MDPMQQLASQLAQLNALLRNGGSSQFLQQSLASLKSFFAKTGMTYRPAAINISVNIATGTNTSGGSADFRIAQDEDFIIREIRGFVVENDQSNAPNAPATLGATNVLAPSERTRAKAQNARVTIQNKDSKVPITENEGISLASITPDVGGLPLRFGPDDEACAILPRNTTVQAVIALGSSNAFFTTSSVNLGVALVGAYVKGPR